MKKFTLALAMLLVLMLPCLPVSAANQQYHVDEIGFSIAFPAEWTVFDRNLADDDPRLDDYGLKAEDIRQLYTANNIYLNALIDSPFSEVVVMTTTDRSIRSLWDLNLRSDQDIEDIFTAVVDSDLTEANGLTYEPYQKCSIGQAVYIRMPFSRMVTDVDGNESSVYGVQYYTILNGNAYSITLHSYEGPIDEELLAAFDASVKTVTFDSVQPKPASALGTLGKVLAIGIGAGVLIAAIVCGIVLVARKSRQKSAVPYTAYDAGAAAPQASQAPQAGDAPQQPAPFAAPEDTAGRPEGDAPQGS
nr:hypothetical protein [bacterium]